MVQRHFLQSKINQKVVYYISLNFGISLQKPEAGSRTIVYAAISPYLEGKGGTYLSNCYYDKAHKKAEKPSETKKLFDFTCELLKIQKFGEVWGLKSFTTFSQSFVIF